MTRLYSLVLQKQRHLKWRALDPLENILMILCGVAITGFSVVVLADVVTRAIGHPLFWAQETMMSFFIYGIFIGVAAATRRNDHLYLAVLAESLSGNKRLFFELFNRGVVLAVAFDDTNGNALHRDPDLRRAGGALYHRADGQRLPPRLLRS